MRYLLGFVLLFSLYSFASEPEDKATQAFILQSGIQSNLDKFQGYVVKQIETSSLDKPSKVGAFLVGVYRTERIRLPLNNFKFDLYKDKIEMNMSFSWK